MQQYIPSGLSTNTAFGLFQNGYRRRCVFVRNEIKRLFPLLRHRHRDDCLLHSSLYLATAAARQTKVAITRAKTMLYILLLYLPKYSASDDDASTSESFSEFRRRCPATKNLLFWAWTDNLIPTRRRLLNFDIKSMNNNSKQG